MPTPRDTQFQGAAWLLCQDLARAHRDTWQQLIARRLYDVVSHTLACVDPSALAYLPHAHVLATIPDVSRWPDEDKATIEAWLTTRPDPKDVERAITPWRRRTAQTYGD